jgi:hypothetical protein
MSTVILALSAISLASASLGTYLAVVDLKGRFRLLNEFRIKTSNALPMVYNVHPAVMQVLADNEAFLVAAQLRTGLNEVIGAIAEDRDAHARTEAGLAKLAGVGDDLRRLKLGSGLLLGGALVGGLAGLLAAATA